MPLTISQKSDLFLRQSWHGGLLMAFSGIDGDTDHDKGLVARTITGRAGLELVAPGKCFITFGQEPQADIILSCDFFSFRSAGATGQTEGVFLDAYHLLICGPVEIFGETDDIDRISNGCRTLIGVKSHFAPEFLDADFDAAFASRSHWLFEQSILNEVSGVPRNTLARALSVMKGQVYSAEGAIRHRWTTPDRWPHKDMWLWDSVFHAIGWRHIDLALSHEIIDAVFDLQREDGFIPHRMSPAGRVSDFTQPPVLAYGVKLVNEIAPDMEWVRRNYPKLKAYLDWDIQNRDVDGGGLLEWFIEEDPHCRSGESGMDNSPRFDGATQLDAVDFNSYFALECEVMAEFAEMLGYDAEAIEWRGRHKKLCELINTYLWSEEDQFYCDYDPSRKMRTPILSSVGFLPLICGAATPERAAALVRHLNSPEMFATNVPVPSIAVRDQKHYSKDMWRGPMWVNINWFIARGLKRYGYMDLSSLLKLRTAKEIERTCELYGTFFEYFDDRKEVDPPQLLRKGVCAPHLNPFRQVIHDYGWTTTLYVDLISKS